MNKRAVRRVHQSDDAVIDVARQIGCEKRCTKFRAELRHLVNWRQVRIQDAPFYAFFRRRAGEPPPSTLWDIHPDMSIAFFTGECRSEDAAGIQRVALRQGRNVATLAGDWLEGPAVVLAGDLL